MKTAILTIALALASSLSALAQTVMRENSTVYFQTNVFLHDDPTNPLHQRISVEGMEPLWVAASNQVVYYLGGEFTNGNFHASNAVIENLSITGGSMTLAQDVKSREATSVGEYGAALGLNTVAGHCGAAFGQGAEANEWGAAFGLNTEAGGRGAAFGQSSISSTWGFSAGRRAIGDIGSFTFADSEDAVFDRTGFTNTFNIRASGGTMIVSPTLNLTTGLTFIATTISGYTNIIQANQLGAHLMISAAEGIYPNIKGGNLLLNPGSQGPTHSRVKVLRGIFEANDIKAKRVGLTEGGSPGSEVLTTWIESDGTNLFFVSTVPPGFTNALTTNTP